MLVLSRKPTQRIKIDGPCEIVVAEIKGNRVKLGIVAEDGVRVVRGELTERKEKKEKKAA